MGHSVRDKQPIWAGGMAPESARPLLGSDVWAGGELIRCPDPGETWPRQIDQLHRSCNLDGGISAGYEFALPHSVDTADDAKAKHHNECPRRFLRSIQHSITAKRVIESVTTSGSKKQRIVLRPMDSYPRSRKPHEREVAPMQICGRKDLI